MPDLKIYNTLTRSKQEVKPLSGDVIRIYSCGLTVYDYAHLGNLRKYVFDDVLVRSLKLLGYQTEHVVNITDVGHLTSDADEGEDKIEKGARREKKSAKEIAMFYEQAFVSDLKQLNILLPDEMPRATENIQEQIDLVKKLEKKGFTYKTSDGIYFDTSKFKGYGKLAGVDKQDLREGARVKKNPEKKNPTDFALWKFSFKNGSVQDSAAPRRQMEWQSPWGIGFPGWHLECSAMATKFLGQPFEIHTGGVDHIGVHHTNEIAQSEAAEGKPLAKYFIHSEHLLQDGRKMAKSAGRFLRLEDLKKKGFDPLDFRFLCLMAHYRSKLDFTFTSLAAARVARKKLNEFYWEGAESGKGELYLDEFKKILGDDLQTPRALSFIFSLIAKAQKGEEQAGAVRSFLAKADEVLAVIGEKPIIPEEVRELVQRRNKQRQERDFTGADKTREKIEALGYGVEDADGETSVKKR